MRLACFVSSHGFGHAARASAVLAALAESIPNLSLDIYSEVPRQFFSKSIASNFHYTVLETDVGMRQLTPMRSDIESTQEKVSGFLQFDKNHLQDLIKRLKSRKTDRVLCDISPLGLEVAARAGIASILLENFTWDWIYSAFVDSHPNYKSIIERMQSINASASLRIRTRPVCGELEEEHTTVGPIARKPLRGQAEVRHDLAVDKAHKLVLITQGGIPGELPYLEKLQQKSNLRFIVTGASKTGWSDNIYLLQNDASVYLSDYLNAADAVVGKLGYSTVAETWRAGLPMLYFTRKDFRESSVLAEFVDNHLNSLAFSEEDYHSGRWLDSIDELIAYERSAPDDPDAGLNEVVELINKS